MKKRIGIGIGILIIILLPIVLAGCDSDNDSIGGDNKMDEFMYQLMNRPPTEEEREERRLQVAEHRRTNVRYIIHYTNFTPAPSSVDLRAIERFVFYSGSWGSGNGLVIDRMFSRVYFDPNTSIIQWLDSIPYSANFQEEDLSTTPRL